MATIILLFSNQLQYIPSASVPPQMSFSFTQTDLQPLKLPITEDTTFFRHVLLFCYNKRQICELEHHVGFMVT